MSELNYPASSLKDLEVFEDMVLLLESPRIGLDFEQLCDVLSTHTEYIISGTQLKLMADPVGIFMVLDELKLKCIDLLRRLLVLRLKSPPMSDELMRACAGIWTFLLGYVQQELEVLFIYYCKMDLKGHLFKN